MTKRDLVLLKNDGMIITADVGTKDLLNDPERRMFSASFNVYELQTRSMDEIREYYDDLEFQFDSDHILHLLKEYDCSPSQLGGRMISHMSLEELVGGDVLGEVHELEDGEFTYFSFSSAGQHDIREDINIKEDIDENISSQVLELLEMWDKFHLKGIDESVEDRAKEIVSEIEDFFDNKKDWELANEIIEDMESDLSVI